MTIHTLLAQANAGGTQIGGFTPPTQSFSAGSNGADGTTATMNFEHFLSNMIGVITIIGGLFFVFYFVMGGLNWITAGGEQGKIVKARDQMIQAVIGMVVIVISYGLIGIIGAFLGFDFLHPGTAILNLKP